MFPAGAGFRAGATTMPKAPDLTGVALEGRYELLALIGEGTFGRVYRGRDRRLARPVAVKVIKPWWAEDPEWVAQFEREAQLLASISDPGIVQIFDVGSAPEGLYYVTELVEGESLVERLQRGALPAELAGDVAEQLATALARAHASRVVHRDVKPANVLISRAGQVKVTDFGVARLAEGSSDAAVGTVVGTPRYMAPEQARGLPASPATDVYGVGVVLYEMLAGRAPFEGSSAVELAFRHVHEPPSALPADVPAALAEVVARALEKEPEDRFEDCAALAAALAGAREDGSAVGARGGRRTRRRRERADGVAVLEPPTLPIPAPRRSLPRSPSTRVAAPYSRRRNVNPPGRRRRIALLAFVVLLGLGMVAGTIALAPSRVRVPELRGLSRDRASALLRHLSLRASFDSRYSDAARRTVLAQAPQHGVRVNDGTTVAVTLSAGPAPVTVPNLVGRVSADASDLLGKLKLRAAVSEIPAPGVPTGEVTRQSPRPGAKLSPRATVALAVAQAPRWWALTSFGGDAAGRSVPFRIRGGHWQMVYNMGYQGTCTLLFICSGPSATVRNLSTGATVQRFDLDEGTNRVWTFTTGPSTYEIAITPGSDAAHWAARVQDYY